MYIDEFNDVINACRFCFMCRHLDPVANVSFREADTPRGRALIADSIRMDNNCIGNRDYIDTMYRSALSGANRTHCVSSYDETGLVLALRRDIVEAGFAPEKVKALADELSSTSFTVSGKGDLLYFGSQPDLYPGCVSITGGDPGKALEVLGFISESREVLERFKTAVAESGCSTLIVSEPSSCHFLADKLDGIKVVHSSEFLNAINPENKVERKAVYLESDYLKNYCESDASKELLAKNGWELMPFGTNDEESTAAGEGAVVFDHLNPELCRGLCNRVAELAGNPGKTPFITASAYVKRVFSKYEPDLKVITVEEAVADI